MNDAGKATQGESDGDFGRLSRFGSAGDTTPEARTDCTI
jgi:hypothetical protein